MLKTVIILGMHRSGTSLTSNILIKLGVNMGDNLYGKTFSNPFGHFEDMDFFELNEDILISAGGNHLEPPKQDAIELQFDKFKDKIKNTIENKAKNSLYGWKDPRTCLTFNLFLPYVENPYIIYCKRDANEIAQSLFKRQNIEINEGLKLTQRYENEIQNVIKKNPNIKKLEITYKELIKNPKYEIKQIVKFLEIDVNEQTTSKAINCIKPKSKIARKVKRRKFTQKIKNKVKRNLAKIKKT